MASAASVAESALAVAAISASDWVSALETDSLVMASTEAYATGAVGSAIVKAAAAATSAAY